MLEWVLEIRFWVPSTACAHLLPDLYTRPRWSWLSKVGALMSISSLPSKEVVALGHSCSQLEQKDVLALDLHTRWAEAGLKTHNSPTKLPVPES